MALLTISSLDVCFDTKEGEVLVLSDVSLEAETGRTLGIVGESGSGKSMLALAILGLVPKPNGRIASGSIVFKGDNLTTAGAERIRSIRGNEIGMIFQEPMTSLNPVFSIGDQIAEAIVQHEKTSYREAWTRAVEALEKVAIPEAEKRAKSFPHQLSGGMRQRVMIAMAVACNPDLIIADEPTTALDVTVQAQVFAVLNEMQERTGAAMLLITHDMGAIAEMADDIVVMYAGRVAETGPARAIIEAPLHPYTKGLIDCVPDISKETAGRGELTEIPGIVPKLSTIGSACAFAGRCGLATDICRMERPSLEQVAPDRKVACHVIAREEAQ